MGDLEAGTKPDTDVGFEKKEKGPSLGTIPLLKTRPMTLPRPGTDGALPLLRSFGTKYGFVLFHGTFGP